MLHYAICKDSHMEGELLCCSFVTDTGVKFSEKSNYDSFLRKKIKTGQIFMVKTNKQQEIHIRQRVDIAPYTKKDYENVISFFKTGKYFTGKEYNWRAIHAARFRLRTVYSRNNSLEKFMEDFDAFFQKD